MPDMEQINELLEEQKKAFHEFKKTNDERLQKLENKQSTAELDEKLSKITGRMQTIEKTLQNETIKSESMDNVKSEIDNLKEDINNLAGVENDKSIEQKTIDLIKSEKKELQDRIDELEGKLNRPDDSKNEDKQDKDIKSFIDFCRKGYFEDKEFEQKAMELRDETTGGYGAPTQFFKDIIKEIVETSPIRTIAKVKTTGRNSMTFPKRGTPAKASRTTEGATRSDKSDSLGNYKREVVSLPAMYYMAKVSTMDLEDTVFDLEGDIKEQFSEGFAMLEGDEFVNGDGVDAMEGILTNSDIGELKSGTNGSIVIDTLIEFIHSFKTPYYNKLKLIFNLSTLGDLMQKKSSDYYIWSPGVNVAGGSPATILGKPYVLVPDMPDVANENYPISAGDYKKGYQIGDRKSMNVQKLVELYATSGQVAFMASKRTGGQVVLAEAIKKYQTTS